MMHPTKKNQVSQFKSPTKATLIRSKSTDQLVSSHKSTSKKNIQQKITQSNQFSQIKVANLSKSKSAKSIKTKNNKQKSKNCEQKSKKSNKDKDKKKVKNNLSQCKTVKKSKNILKRMNLSEQSFNSFQSLKKPSQQYFLYQNNYISIENSAQRRFVIKIKEIDSKCQKHVCEQSTSDAFFKKVIVPQSKCQEVQTQKTETNQVGLNTSQQKSEEGSAQTQKYPIEDAAKCFSQTLTDLQFLFMPDQKNFQCFSKAQRVHYKQLLQSIAIKVWNSGNVNLQQLTPQKIQLLLYERQCIQMGLIQYFPQQGFPTHVYSVMSYLSNLVSYAQIQDRDEILSKFQSICGYNYRQRFSKVIKGQPTYRKSNGILNQELFLGLQHELFKDHQFTSQLIQKCVHIHNKAIFDAVNQQLEKYKPFYSSKGQPFPWSINFGMTYFSIDESSLGFLFRQIKQKILTKFGYLCGILVDYDNYKQLSTAKHEMHEAKIKCQQIRMIHDQLDEFSDEPQMIQENVRYRTELSDSVMKWLIDELCQDLMSVQNSQKPAESDFVFEF